MNESKKKTVTKNSRRWTDIELETFASVLVSNENQFAIKLERLAAKKASNAEMFEEIQQVVEMEMGKQDFLWKNAELLKNSTNGTMPLDITIEKLRQKYKWLKSIWTSKSNLAKHGIMGPGLDKEPRWYQIFNEGFSKTHWKKSMDPILNFVETYNDEMVTGNGESCELPTFVEPKEELPIILVDSSLNQSENNNDFNQLSFTASDHFEYPGVFTEKTFVKSRTQALENRKRFHQQSQQSNVSENSQSQSSSNGINQSRPTSYQIIQSLSRSNNVSQSGASFSVATNQSQTRFNRTTIYEQSRVNFTDEGTETEMTEVAAENVNETEPSVFGEYEEDQPSRKKKRKIENTAEHSHRENFTSITHGLSAILDGINRSIEAQNRMFERQLNENSERERRMLEFRASEAEKDRKHEYRMAQLFLATFHRGRSPPIQTQTNQQDNGKQNHLNSEQTQEPINKEYTDSSQ